MGKIERLIVVGVVSLIAVILAVTFSPSEDGAGNRVDVDPLTERTAYTRLDDETGTKAVHTETNRPSQEDLNADPIRLASESKAQDKRLALLNTGVTVPAKAPQPERIPQGSILITTQGLEDSYLEDFKIYRPKHGEDYASLSERFYGDAGRGWLLQRYNEGQDTVVAGKAMFVPVFQGADDVELEAAPIAASGETYLVQEGDSLWTIAKDLYGNGATWQKLHDANLDLIPSAHDLKPGIVLRVPR